MLICPSYIAQHWSRCLQVTLEVNNSEAAARIVKARLERTTLGQVAKRIRATLRPVSSMAVRLCPLAICCIPPAMLLVLLQVPECNRIGSKEAIKGRCSSPWLLFMLLQQIFQIMSSPSSCSIFHGSHVNLSVGFAATQAHMSSSVRAPLGH